MNSLADGINDVGQAVTDDTRREAPGHDETPQRRAVAGQRHRARVERLRREHRFTEPLLHSRAGIGSPWVQRSCIIVGFKVRPK
jgi:hypothetical protein